MFVSNLKKSYSDTITVDEEEGFAHVLVGVAFEELLAEPNVETGVVLALQFIAFATQAVHRKLIKFFIWN
jgi:hypothetical protein